MGQLFDQSLQNVVENWKRMQASDGDQAEQAADRFEASFYVFIDDVQLWYSNLEKKVDSLEAALELPEIQMIADQLPEPLYLVFETELELILEGSVRIEDDAEY